MKKIVEKWYFSLVILPIVINVISNKIELPYLFGNWSYTIIAILIISVLILTYELIIIKKRLRQSVLEPKDGDKKIIHSLLDVLDIDTFQEKIYLQNSWYGYNREAIYKAINFAEQAGYLSNQTTDNRLNKKIAELKESIDDFNEFSSSYLYSDNDHSLTPAKENDFNREKSEKACPIMNEKADIAYKHLEGLLKYLKDNNYIG